MRRVEDGKVAGFVRNRRHQKGHQRAGFSRNQLHLLVEVFQNVGVYRCPQGVAKTGLSDYNSLFQTSLNMR